MLETPSEVVKSLLSIARASGYSVVRLSGGEPTLCFNHLLSVLDEFSSVRGRYEVFVLETNGILLGINRDFVKSLAPHRDYLLIRVSIKGCSEDEFNALTGLSGELYRYHIEALKNIADEGIPYSIAIPISFCSKNSLSSLVEKLIAIVGEEALDRLEPEVVILYPSVIKRLCEKGLTPWIAFDPTGGGKVKDVDLYGILRRRCREIS